MEKCDNLILTGWGYAEYVASAAVALKALNGNADVMGVSRRRLPELVEEIAGRKKSDRWSAIYILGVSLLGDPERLAEALGKLKKEGILVIDEFNRSKFDRTYSYAFSEFGEEVVADSGCF